MWTLFLAWAEACSGSQPPLWSLGALDIFGHPKYLREGKGIPPADSHTAMLG